MKMDKGQYMRYALLFFFPRKRLMIARSQCGMGRLFLPGDMLRSACERFGYPSMLLAELLLFGWCFLVTLLMDLIWPGYHVIKAFAGSLCCLAAFGLCCDEPVRYFIKLVFLTASAFWSDSCFLTAVFLLAFERIAVKTITDLR